MHLVLDGYGSNPDVLCDEKFIYKLLDEYPARIGMHKISSPRVLTYIGERPEEWGVSGFVFIAESHISIHTFVENRYVNMDVFSCRDFDAQLAIDDIVERLQLRTVKTHILDRNEPHVHSAGTDEAAPLKL